MFLDELVAHFRLDFEGLLVKHLLLDAEVPFLIKSIITDVLWVWVVVCLVDGLNCSYLGFGWQLLRWKSSSFHGRLSMIRHLRFNNRVSLRVRLSWIREAHGLLFQSFIEELVVSVAEMDVYLYHEHSDYENRNILVYLEVFPNICHERVIVIGVFYKILL